MAFNIQDLKSSLKYGGARGTLFQVQIFNPVDSSASIDIPFKIRAASIPESNLGTIPVYYFGRPINFSGDRQPFAPWDVTVINDEDFLVRNSLEAWSNAINALERNIRDLPGPEASLYKSDAVVFQYSKTGQIIREYTMYGCWPSSISGMGLDWSSTDTIQEYGVTFTYDHWAPTGGGFGGTYQA